jgi:Holliday junction resolvase RusA-like endonuclease
MVKSVLDVLPIDDDARVVKITASKYYAAYGEDPKIELSIRSAEIKKSLD